MTLIRSQVKIIYWLLSIPLLSACVGSIFPSEKQTDLKVDLDFLMIQNDLQPGVNLKQNATDHMGWAQRVGSRGNTLAGELSMLGVSRVEPVDVGFAGKMGHSVVFAAEKRLIPDYDRLYWVMIRVLSEKYGCFIRKKIDRGELVAFKCRDQRIVTFRRRLTERYAVFKARQYRSDGREIVIANKRSTRVAGSRVVAKQP
jgi:hypothetical protein